MINNEIIMAISANDMAESERRKMKALIKRKSKAAASEIMVSKRNENESVGENVEEINESVSNGQ
jgi:hypothetical protein